MKKKQYHVIVSSELDYIIQSVNKHLALGGECLGGLVIVNYDSGNVYHQAMLLPLK